VSARVQFHERAFVASRVAVSRYRVVPLSRHLVITSRCVGFRVGVLVLSLIARPCFRHLVFSSFRRPSPCLGLGRRSAKSDRQRGWDRVEQRYKAGRLPEFVRAH
jgi:hypothetical protein